MPRTERSAHEHRQGPVLAMVAVCTLMGSAGLQDFESISSQFTPPANSGPCTGGRMGVKWLSKVIRGHGSVIGNGVHHRREVRFGEDRCRARDRGAAEALAIFPYPAMVLCEKDRALRQASVRSFRAWRKRQTLGKAHALLKG